MRSSRTSEFNELMGKKREAHNKHKLMQPLRRRLLNYIINIGKSDSNIKDKSEYLGPIIFLSRISNILLEEKKCLYANKSSYSVGIPSSAVCLPKAILNDHIKIREEAYAVLRL